MSFLIQGAGFVAEIKSQLGKAIGDNTLYMPVTGRQTILYGPVLFNKTGQEGRGTCCLKTHRDELVDKNINNLNRECSRLYTNSIPGLKDYRSP